MGTWLIDLDGVMWHGARPIAGSAGAITTLVELGHRVVFCTNHAVAPEAKAELLVAQGVPSTAVVTSAEAAGSRCGRSERVLVLGDPSLVEVLSRHIDDVVDVRSLDAASGDPSLIAGFDAVVVGSHDDWDRARTGLAADAIRAGARFLATNDDPTFPVERSGGMRLLPGAGSIVAAVSVACGVAPEITGKPHAAMADLITSRYGEVAVVVGDQPLTDGALADRLGAAFGLVLSGVTSASDLPLGRRVDLVAADLAGLVTAASGRHGHEPQ